MKKILLTVGLILAVPFAADAARQSVTQITGTQASVGALKTQVNTRFDATDDNFIELYDGKADKTAAVRYWSDWPTTSPNNVLAVNTIVAYNGSLYKVTQELTKTGSTADPETLTAYFSEVTGGSEYTLPTAAADTLGGIKVGARLSINNGVLSADVQSGTGLVDSVNTKVGAVVLNPDDLSDTNTTNKFVTAAQKALLDGANQFKLAGPNPGTYGPTYIQGGAVTNPSGILLRGPIDLPASTTELMTIDNLGQMSRLAQTTFQNRVSGTCSAGSSIREIAANGTVTCETDDTGSSPDLASPGTIGGTTPGAGYFTNLYADSITINRTNSASAIDLYEGLLNGNHKVTIAPSVSLSADKSIVAENILQTTDVDDTPVNGVTDAPVSSNWAFDHAAATATHGISGAIVGTSDSATLTNKTLDVEDTGNAITIVDKIWFAAAGCNNTTAASFYDLPTSNPAAAACITGTNTQKGVLDFDAGTDESGQVTLMLPTDAAELTSGGGVDITLKWLAAATSGSVVWGVQTSCVADAETDDPSWNTASTVTDAAKGTTLQTNDATIGDVTMTGCAAGELLHLRIFRDADNGSDDMTGDARLIGAEVTIRRAQ